MAACATACDAANRRSLVVIGGFAVAAVLLALVGGFVISWAFILPVQAAHGFLSDVAAGHFGGTVTVRNRDEFGALAAQLNAHEPRARAARRGAAAAPRDELGALNAGSSRRAGPSRSSSPT